MRNIARKISVGATVLTFIVALSSLASCAYPTRNYPLDVPMSKAPYRWGKLEHLALGDTLVIVSASGGGTRATALTMAVLRGMEQVKLPAGNRLTDEVDVISSVSGGSVAAADFALYGAAGFDDLENNFVRKDGIAAMLEGFLNPVRLAQTSTNSRERIDTLIDYLDSTLFHDKTMGALADGKVHPYLVLNAGDMVEGTPFAMTQDNFDLLCSDVSKTKISTAVAASAAFPVALSPVTLTNYSPCATQRPSAGWPPPWVEDATGTAWYDNEEYAVRGRVAAAYMQGASGSHPKKFIHLLDGGIADNLGVMEPYRMLATTEVSPSFLNRIGSGEIKKIIFVLVNARSAASSSLDQSQATPGIVDMLLGTIDAGIDRTAMGNKERVRQLLRDAFAEQARIETKAGETEEAKNLTDISNNTFLISIDFDAIENAGCRAAYHSIPTSWTLKSEQVDAILKIGPALLQADPDFPKVLAATGGSLAAPLPKVDTACKALSAT